MPPGSLVSVTATSKAAKGTPKREVGDFYISAMDTNRLEQLRFKPLAADLKRINGMKSTSDLFRLLARFHDEGVGGIFGEGVEPDAKQSSIYALELEQGGLSLPDRDYYLKEGFASQREAYTNHVAKMFTLLGDAMVTTRIVDRCKIPPQGLAGGRPGRGGGVIVNRGQSGEWRP